MHFVGFIDGLVDNLEVFRMKEKTKSLSKTSYLN